MSTVNTSVHFIVVIGWIIVGQFVLMDRWTHRLRCPLVFKGSFGQLLCSHFGFSRLSWIISPSRSLDFAFPFFKWIYTCTSNIIWVLFIFFIYIYTFIHNWVVEVTLFVIFSFPSTNCFIKYSALWLRLFLCLSIKENRWLPTLYRPPPDCSNHQTQSKSQCQSVLTTSGREFHWLRCNPFSLVFI